MRSFQILYKFVLRVEKVSIFAAKIVTFPKLCSFTDFRMSFSTVVENFDFPA